MLIECTSCKRTYHVARAVLGATGRAVLCTHCDVRWFVASDGSAGPILAPAPGPEIVAEAQSERSRPQSYEELYGPAPRPAPAAVSRRGGLAPPRLAPSLALLLALVAVPSALIAARVPLVKRVPQAAGLFAAVGLPVNVRGLSLAGVATHRGDSGHEALLDVEGDIGNIRERTTAVPPLRLTILDGQGQPIYGWTAPAPRQTLGVGEHVTFHARLVAPPAAGTTVVVRFAEAGETKSR